MTIQMIQSSQKPTHEQRLAKHVKGRQIQTKNSLQLEKTKTLKKHSKLAKRAVEAIIVTLRGFGAEITIEHTKADLLPIPAGESGFGKRETFKHIWFNEEDENPHFGGLSNGEECYIYAQEASGYSVAKVVLPASLPVGSSDSITVYGKSICSANENFNGNIGAFFALMDALHLIARREDLGSPIQNLFFFAASILPLDLDSPSHYEENLSLALERASNRRIENENDGFIKLKADVNEKVKLIDGPSHLIGKTAIVQVIHGHGTVRGFLKLYEPAYEVLIFDEQIQVRLNSEDIEKV